MFWYFSTSQRFGPILNFDFWRPNLKLVYGYTSPSFAYYVRLQLEQETLINHCD